MAEKKNLRKRNELLPGSSWLLRRFPLLCTICGLVAGILLYLQTALPFWQIFFRALVIGLSILMASLSLLFLAGWAKRRSEELEVSSLQVPEDENQARTGRTDRPVDEGSAKKRPAARPAPSRGGQSAEVPPEASSDMETGGTKEWHPLELETVGSDQ